MGNAAGFQKKGTIKHYKGLIVLHNYILYAD